MDIIPPQLEMLIKDGYILQYTDIKGEIKYQKLSKPITSATFISKYNNVMVTILSSDEISIFDIEKDLARTIKLPIGNEERIQEIYALDEYNNIVCYIATSFDFYVYNINEDKHIKIYDHSITSANIISNIAVSIGRNSIYLVNCSNLQNMETIKASAKQIPCLFPHGVIFYNEKIIIYNISRGDKIEIKESKGFNTPVYLDKGTFIVSNGINKISEYNLQGEFIRSVKRDNIHIYHLPTVAVKLWNNGSDIRKLRDKYGTSNIDLLSRPLQIQVTEIRNYLSKIIPIPSVNRNIRNLIFKFIT